MGLGLGSGSGSGLGLGLGLGLVGRELLEQPCRRRGARQLRELRLRRYRGDVGEMRARCGRDVGEIWGRCGRDMGVSRLGGLGGEVLSLPPLGRLARLGRLVGLG